MKLILCLFFLNILLQDGQAQTRKVNVDGVQVTVPATINRIADAWPAHNMIVYMLGQGDKIVATSISKRMCPWFYKINPSMEKAVTTFAASGDNSMEELIKAKPNIVFLTKMHANAEAISRMGFTVVELSFSDFPGLRKCVLTTAEVLGGEAKSKAEKYVTYLDSNIKKIQQVTANIPVSKKPKVLHITSLSPITVSGSNMMMDAWIKLCGGVNAAVGVENSKQVSSEQILLWNPDIIIYAGTSTDIKEQDVLSNPALKNTKAGKNKQIYINPKGLFFWDRYSAEEALQIQWAAQKFYPDKFKSFDVVEETIYFYKSFFDYSLTKEEAEMIIKGQSPN
ncbi:iron complex transport system substrate-binding protein [termite gut metagenome]|uniref:Iron complex transport system substrate-binding protein n=1 Tax=termite gut metagenome TaxID=433724 RepID=A0A5J4SEU1_9ZZZZ